MARKSLSAPDPASIPPIDLLEAIGGSQKCRELSTAFYAGVVKHPTLRPLFPGKTQKCAIEALTAFLVQLLGGTTADTARRFWLSLHESHLRFEIGQKERNAWVEVMSRTLCEAEMGEPMRSALQELFEESSTYLVNTGPAVSSPKEGLGASEIHAEMRRRWEQQRALDGAVAAIRAGELKQVTAMVESPVLQACFQRSRSSFAQFVGVLTGSGHDAMTEYALRTLLENPDLAHRRYSGRTLLHTAAAAGNLPMAAALLKLGVDADTQTEGGHTPLYCVGNECTGGGAIVRALIEAGARVDACDGTKRCTALHMAARRGNIETAETLLECGANIEARDSLGETPLRRAVNCGQTGVAALLLARGADPHSVGSKGLTPRSAARSGAMRDLLQSMAPL